ncbi:prolyl endopeptidase [Phaffia rhodozyma]|uniref:Prolyl endopeptidase n=1 Tax=Phaffia rhodozyma TaxID=264483 RepID=A0A0F7SXQ0_PHARH|nr:prolyl endopeptidase [Phaffia rhodozyma]
MSNVASWPGMMDRHLEDPFAESTKSFVKAQNDTTDRYLLKFPHGAALKTSLRSITSFPLVSSFQKSPCGSFFYWKSNPGHFDQPVWLRSTKVSTADNWHDAEVFFDVNQYSTESEGSASEAWSSFSDSGKYWATTISRGGSDWQTVVIIDTQTKKQVDEELLNVKFCWTLAWLGDQGFVYKIGPTKHKDNTSAERGYISLIHYIGTPQSEDLKIFEDPICQAYLPIVSQDKKHLITSLFKSTDPTVRLLTTPVRGLDDAQGKAVKHDLIWSEVTKPWDGSYIYIGTSSKGISYFKTNRDSSPRYKISGIDLDLTTTQSQWIEIVPSHPKGVLERAISIGSGLILVVFAVDVANELWIFNDEGETIRRVRDDEIPWTGVVNSLDTGKNTNEFSVLCESYIAPPTLYRGVVADGDVVFSMLHCSNVDGWSESDYIQKQVIYPSKDGTLIPMHICYSSFLESKSAHPTLLFGYGGFGWAQEPKWEPLFASFMKDFKGIVAVAGIRGGGEHGNEWHKAAVGVKRQTGYDDFLEAARWLKETGLSSKIVVHGASNGGLLCSAVSNQAPDLIDATLPDVGVHDLLRFHKFTMGALWTAEYGSPEDPEEFASLLKISPLHNIPSQQNFPACFLTTAEHDSRVIPGHTLKFAATLQERQSYNEAPMLYRIYTDTGHGMGKSVDQQIKENTEKLSFVAVAMNLSLSR